MQQQARTELNAFELLMQDHREIEWLLRTFEHLQRAGKDTTETIGAACAELKAHDTLEHTVLYGAVAAADPGGATEDFLRATERDHDAILELIEKIECERGGDENAHFMDLAERVKRHIHSQETEFFPVVRRLRAFDIEAVTSALRERRTALGGFGA